MRTRIVWSRAVAPLAAAFGATASRSSVDVADDVIEIRAGVLGSARIPRASVAGARVIAWRTWWGFGIRMYGKRAWGYVGTRAGVVEISLSEPVRIKVPFPVKVTRVAASVADPEALIEAINAR